MCTDAEIILWRGPILGYKSQDRLILHTNPSIVTSEHVRELLCKCYLFISMQQGC